MSVQHTEKKHHRVTHHVKRVFRDEDKLLFASFVVVLTALVVLVAVYVSNKDSHAVVVAKTAMHDTAPTKVLMSQQVAESSAYFITISSVSETDTPDPAFAIAADETMLIATLSITNASDRTQDLIPATQLYVRSSDGIVYRMHPSVRVTEPLQSGKIDSGQTIRGQVSFAVPKSLERPLLYIDLGWNNYTPVVYDVLR